MSGILKTFRAAIGDVNCGMRGFNEDLHNR